MSGRGAPVWVVAGDVSARIWATALEAEGIPAVPLRWSELARSTDEDAAERAMRAGDHDLVLLTSRNAVAFLPEEVCRSQPAACVGKATAEAARERGFDVRLVGAAGGEALAHAVLATLPDVRRILFLRARDARPEARDVLVAAGREVVEAESYAMRPRADFAQRVAQAPDPAAIIVGSPRAAEALVAAVAEGAAATRAPVVVMGDATANTVAASWPASIHRATADRDLLGAALRPLLESADDASRGGT